MLNSQSTAGSETLLESSDEDERYYKYFPGLNIGRMEWKLYHVITFCCISIACLTVSFASTTLIKGFPDRQTSQVQHSKSCLGPPLRREWRSLASGEKEMYVRAVKCLKTIPSRLGMNHTLYDDFPWVHNTFGEYSHDAAPFLAWHRYFIHLYERALKEQCGYTGHLTYWDWTLDWENITTSPIWDSETGFGGNGNMSVGRPIFSAHCVTEGPFARLEVPYFEHIYRPHCLMRGFETDETLSKLRVDLRPQALENLLRSENYDLLNLGLENGPHVAIPRSINGDFSLHTAPFDPVFFLHHTQLDRMWWRWQQMDFPRRSKEYSGKAAYNSTEEASLLDEIPMGGLAPDITILEIMTTRSELLCYQY